MILNYFRQAWTLVRQHKLFTSIYVVGTGLSIALVMTLFIIFYVKFGPVYPEYNWDRTLVIKYMQYYPKSGEKNFRSGGVSQYVMTDLLPGLPHLETIAAMEKAQQIQVGVTGSNQVFKVFSMKVNAGFWKVFTFHFLSGKPFTEADTEAAARVVVISESMARRLFSTVAVTGRDFLIKGRKYRVCGVVQDVSSATPASAADMWLPFVVDKSFTFDEGLRGGLSLYLTAPSKAEKEALKAEVQEAFHKFNTSTKEYVNDLMEQPDDYWKSTFRTDSSKVPDWEGQLRVFAYILLALLFIPAVNLGGMISSRMDTRIAELGIRKAYGATNATLVRQVLTENFLLTFMGGIVGLIVSYLIVVMTGNWILTLFDDRINMSLNPPFLTFEMLFNPYVFGTAFVVCLLLNVISALVPTLLALRNNIVQSLHHKR